MLLPTQSPGTNRDVSAFAHGAARGGLQMSAIARNPFSGYCFSTPSYTCCVLCYVDNCYYYCWAPARLPTGF